MKKIQYKIPNSDQIFDSYEDALQHGKPELLHTKLHINWRETKVAKITKEEREYESLNYR